MFGIFSDLTPFILDCQFSHPQSLDSREDQLEYDTILSGLSLHIQGLWIRPPFTLEISSGFGADR